jgi:Na+/proline symporter/signal transduction histidine kinase
MDAQAMTGLTVWFLVFVALAYLGLLSLAAHYSEKLSQRKMSLLRKPWIYSLSLAVYCTAWTFYGSVGRAVEQGIDFLTIYIGPLIGCVLFWFVLRKMIRISKAQKISSLADFLSNRYGKSITLGVLISVFSVIGILPYISLQLKSISESIFILTNEESLQIGAFAIDTGFVMAFALAIFIVFFGFRKIDLTDKHEGVVVAIALESIIKLISLIAVGIFALYIISQNGGWVNNQDVIPQKPIDSFHWSTMIILSLFAFFLLPRQFQMAITENVDEQHVKKATWQFPLYLLIINLCVIPIAIAGKINLGDGYNPDYFVLNLPLNNQNTALATLAFFGGFAAASGMIIVSTISLATMLTNNILLPFVFKLKLFKEPQRFISYVGIVRRSSVFVIAILAYLYYEFIAFNNSLVSIGLTSFAAVAQFAPATIGALFWKKGNKKGAIWGIAIGAAIWFYTLILPMLIHNGSFGTDALSFLQGHHFFNPEELFGIPMPSQLSGSVFWSLFFNTLFYIGLSIFSNQSSMELNQAELFVDVYDYSGNIEENLYWRGVAKNKDLSDLMHSFLGKSKANQAKRIFEQRYSQGPLIDDEKADRKFVAYTENVLTGVVGTSSARIMVSSVSQEEEIRMDDVISILKESKEILELNKQLQKTSLDLQKVTEDLTKANSLLVKQDELKNEFLYTITHEIRTPITSIRAFTEILQDDDVCPTDRKRFKKIMGQELERLSRLISQVLDLEKYESGKSILNLTSININQLLDESVMACDGILKEKTVRIIRHFQDSLEPINVDADKLKQVFINLISNAAKYGCEENPEVVITTYFVDDTIRINVRDNGVGISNEEGLNIFDKFYQIQNNSSKNGNGLGLAICREIIHLHNGQIWLDKEYRKGAKFCILLPTKNLSE